LDGTLHVWKTNSNLARPDRSCDTAHTKDTETTGIAWSPDGTRLATRGGDDTVKCESLFALVLLFQWADLVVWDPKSMRKPLAVAEGMGNIYPETNLTYSPDGKSILTGLPGRKEIKGALVFLSALDLSEQRRIAIGEGSVVRVLWHSRINQASLIFTHQRHSLTSDRS
jgi:WD40 repeat protein